MTLKTTISEKTMRRGKMPTSRLLPKVLRVCFVSAVASSFVDSRKMSRNVAKAPNAAPTDSVATVVTVVVTVEIINSPSLISLINSQNNISVMNEPCIDEGFWMLIICLAVIKTCFGVKL